MTSSCGCGIRDAPPPETRGKAHLDIDAVIERNVRLLQKGAAERTLRFPELSEAYGRTALISTFSHLNPNLPVDEIYGNYVLKKIQQRAGLSAEEVLNVAYDNIHPGHDAPKGHRMQYVIASVDVLEPERVIHLQPSFLYDPSSITKDGQNRVKSAPEQNIEAFRGRYDEVEDACRRHSGPGNVAQRILAIRREFFRMMALDIVPEQAFSQALTRPLADVLELLYRKGYPFWEMPIPAHRDRYVEYTYLVEGVDRAGSRQPARFADGAFVFPDGEEEKRITADRVFHALRAFEVVPTMPLVILSTTTAPQMPHLGGMVWKEYAPPHVEAQAEWLGLDERSDTLVLSTEGYKPLVTYRYNQEFTGFPAVYMTFGRAKIRQALEEGRKERVEFKRVVIE